jgi:chaperonin GroEL
MSKKKPQWQKPGVVFQPQVHTALKTGIDSIVNAISPTLGPTPRLVLYDLTVGTTGRLPELLDNGGLIARRILQIPDRDADVGAMLLRHTIWRQHEEVGDGTATTAVMFQAIYNEGIRFIVAGGNAMRLRVHLERGLRVILDELATMTSHIYGKERLARLAETICYDNALAKILGEIFDIIGEYGRLEIRSSQSRSIEREYVEGMYWDSGLLSRAMATDQGRMRAELENPAVLLTNFDIEDPRDLIPALAITLSKGIDGLIVVARKMSDTVLGLIATNQQQKRIKATVVGVKTPGIAITDQRAAVMDMAILTGGHPFLDMSGEKLKNLKPEDLGYARRVWANKDHTGIIGGKGDPRKLRKHIAGLRASYNIIADPRERETLQGRIGKLMGGSATLYIGGSTKPEIDFNKELAKRTADAMRGAMREGVVPGGGVALLNCRSALEKRLAEADELEARAAYRILLSAIEAPIRTLMQNAGIEPGVMFADIIAAGPGYGVDVKTGKVVHMAESGILDAASVVKTTAINTIKTAALALTTDVVVHRRNPPEEFET